MKDKMPQELYDLVMFRDHNRCQLCAKKLYLEVHHIVQKSLGGKNILENLIVLCYTCHRAVGNSLSKKEELLEMAKNNIKKMNSSWLFGHSPKPKRD